MPKGRTFKGFVDLKTRFFDSTHLGDHFLEGSVKYLFFRVYAAGLQLVLVFRRFQLDLIGIIRRKPAGIRGQGTVNFRWFPLVFLDGTGRFVSISGVFRLGSIPVPEAGTIDLG